MTGGSPSEARKPADGIHGLDPRWSRLVRVDKTDGVGRTWHILDSHHGGTGSRHVNDEPARLTLLCVHGNPSWSFLWRQLLAATPDDIRVIAVDQLDMGFSERTGLVRRLATRVQDLCELTDHLGLTGPEASNRVVTVAHDWGGPVSLGWAQRNRTQLAGVVLLNTSVHQPAGSPAPSIIRAIRTRGILRRITADTSTFITGAVEMSRPRLSAPVRAGFHAPYQTPERRQAITSFVEDIPLDPSHPSATTLDAIADGLKQLVDLPALLMWGPRDKVFSDLYLHDLESRLPQADVHRFPGASHFVSEDADTTSALFTWLEARFPSPTATTAGATEPPTTRDERASLFSGLECLADSTGPAVTEMPSGTKAPSAGLTTGLEATADSISFAAFHKRVLATAQGLADAGVKRGDRVALMIPPGIDLSVALYSCWRAGAITVLIDSGLGAVGMSRALSSAAPQHLIGVTKALAAGRALHWPGQKLSVAALPPTQKRVLGVSGDLRSLANSKLPDSSLASSNLANSSIPVLAEPDPSDQAAVVFTSGATGPSKGVRYRHGQLQAQRDALAQTYGITPDDRLVAAFAPFALYGPALGILSVVPDMDISAPGTLTARALGDAVVVGQATMVFASPAALANVVATATSTTSGFSSQHRAALAEVRILLSAGAPLRPSLLSAVGELFPNAIIHTPYGMTEVLPTTSISLPQIQQATLLTEEAGVCVGMPVDGVEIQIAALDQAGHASPKISSDPGVLGEIVIRAPHARDGYDRLWLTDHLASQPAGWHRSGDVGHLDASGQLWVEGRIGHVITTATGPVTPVGLEHRIEDLDGIELAAIVGVGPPGVQQVVAAVQMVDTARRPHLAPLILLDQVRATTKDQLARYGRTENAIPPNLAAVLVVPKLPVDRRHNSKIDRTRVAAWASKVLAGGRMGNRPLGNGLLGRL